MAVSAVVAYDGSPGANAAIEAGALLFPAAHGWITHLWAPPFASDALHRRLRARAGDVAELVALVEQEDRREAQRLVGAGVTLAWAAEWQAEPLLKQCWGGDGLRLAEVAERTGADVVLVGSRGLGGGRAVLGSVSDTVVHYCSRPVVVIPFPLLAAEHAALRDGPRACSRSGRSWRPVSTRGSRHRPLTAAGSWDPGAAPLPGRSCSAVSPWPPPTTAPGR